MFVTTTIAVIYFTVFLQGITIKPLVKFLKVERANKKKPTMNERIHERVIFKYMLIMKNLKIIIINKYLIYYSHIYLVY